MSGINKVQNKLLLLMLKSILLIAMFAMLLSCSSSYHSKRGEKFFNQLTPISLSDIKAGDILFIVSDGTASDVIRVGQKLYGDQHYYFNHVAMAISDASLIHSTFPKGASAEKIWKYFRKNKSAQVIVVRNKNSDIAQGAAEFGQIIMAINRRNNNFSYSIEKAIESLTINESNKYLQDEEDFESMLQGDNQEIFCSKLIAYIYSFTYKQNRLSLNIPSYNTITPSSLADALIEDQSSDFYVVGRVESRQSH